MAKNHCRRSRKTGMCNDTVDTTTFFVVPTQNFFYVLKQFYARGHVHPRHHPVSRRYSRICAKGLRMCKRKF